MFKRLQALLRSDYFANISIQFTGTAIAQLIPFLASPILARLYTEEGFAMLTLFMAITGVLVVPNGGRYFFAIVLPKDEKEADTLGALSFWITIFYNLFLFTLIAVFYGQLNQYYQLNELWYLVPVYVAFFGLYNIVLYFSVRRKKFKVNAMAKIAQTFGSTLMSIILSFLGMLSTGLVLGRFTGLIFSIPFFRVKIKLKTDLYNLKLIARRHLDYPKLTILPALLDVISLQALILFVGKYYSEDTLGYLGLTNMILVAPIALVGISFRDVFYQKITGYFHVKAHKKAKALFRGSAAALFIIGAALALLLYFFGEVIFAFIFGERWISSGVFASILSFSLLAKLVASPLSSIFNATNQLRLLSFWQVTYFITTMITLYLSIAYFEVPIEKALLIYTLHEVLLYLLYFVLQNSALSKFKPLA